MNIFPYTNDTWNKFPHVILTSGDEWYSTNLDYNIDDNDGDSDDDDWSDSISGDSTKYNDTLFDPFRIYKHRHIIHGIEINKHDIGNGIFSNNCEF